MMNDACQGIPFDIEIGVDVIEKKIKIRVS